MALACEDDGVPFAGVLEGFADRHFPIDFRQVLLAGLLKPHNHVAHDAQRVFAARVVRSQNGEIAQGARRFSHERALGAVSFPSASENDDQPIPGQLACGLQDVP